MLMRAGCKTLPIRLCHDRTTMTVIHVNFLIPVLHKSNMKLAVNLKAAKHTFGLLSGTKRFGTPDLCTTNGPTTPQPQENPNFGKKTHPMNFTGLASNMVGNCIIDPNFPRALASLWYCPTRRMDTKRPAVIRQRRATNHSGL